MPTYRIKTTETATEYLTHWYYVEADSLEEVLDLFDDQGFATSRFYDKGLDPIDTKSECGDSAGDECLCEVREESKDSEGRYRTATLVYPTQEGY